MMSWAHMHDEQIVPPHPPYQVYHLNSDDNKIGIHEVHLGLFDQTNHI